MTGLAPPLSERNETPLERCDRNLGELLQEVRVAQTGVQVLFGFLLMVPFANRFYVITPGERALYLVTLVAAGAAALLLIAPSAHHRMLFQCGDKERLVRSAHRAAIAGLAFVGVAMTGALALIASVVVGPAVAIALGVITALACAWGWFLGPLRRRRELL